MEPARNLKRDEAPESPRSGFLSLGINRYSMTENYRPRSPDLSSLPIPSNPPPYAPLSPLAHRASYDASPFFNPTAQAPRVSEQYVPPFQDEMARRSSRLQDDAPVPEASGAMPTVPDEIPQARPGAGIEVKTKFPVARIKRIMQADEDVGKVAQVTPIAVCMSRTVHKFPRIIAKLPPQPKHWSSS